MTWPATGLVVIVGPTAAGKSSLAEALARRHGAELVSADALQVYRGLDIGTAKAPAQVRAELDYHGLDLYGPDDRSTAGRYARWAREVLAEIRERGRRAVLVGGSGFYVRATLEPLDSMPSTDPDWRRGLTALASSRGDGELHRWLRRLDPVRAKEIDPADGQRLLRAVEVVLRTGRRVAELRSDPALAPPRPVATIGLRWPREALARRIEARVERMFECGWVEEVRGLLDAGVTEEAHALQAIGYRELVRYLRGELDLEPAREAIVRATRRYAKRQMTWFRGRDAVSWIDLPMAGGTPGVVRAAERIITAAASPCTP